jgi:hypothetical protein
MFEPNEARINFHPQIGPVAFLDKCMKPDEGSRLFVGIGHAQAPAILATSQIGPNTTCANLASIF